MNDESRGMLAAEIRETVPSAPGVYAFCDGDGMLLYVGKSVKLRQRMASYFHRAPLNTEPHVGRLVSSIRGFAWWQTRTELLALLLEDVLIKQHLPPHNTRQREFEENRYLELTEGDFPACVITEHAADFGAREIWGPFKDKYFAATLQDVLHEIIGIRTCSEPSPVRHCLEHDMDRCSGPCRGKLDPFEYQDLVAQARDFLNGEADAVLDRLVKAMDQAAAVQRYEEAARLRDAIDTSRRFAARQRFTRRFEGGDCRILSAEDGVEYHFKNGALAAPHVVVIARGESGGRVSMGRTCFRPDTAGNRAVAALHRSPSDDRRFLADRARIVYSWADRRDGGDHLISTSLPRASHPHAARRTK